MTEGPGGFAPPPSPPPPPPPPKPWSLPPELEDDDDPFKEKRFQKELQFRMVGAIENANTKLLKSLIHSGVDTNARILLVKTPLTHAVDQDEISLDILTNLLEGGADPNLADFTPRRLAPLHVIASKGNIDAAEIVITQSKSYTCDTEISDKGGCTPLHFAARFGHLEMVQYLLNQSADINSKDLAGCSALHRACENLHFEVAKYLLESGHCVNVRDNFSWTPLFYSVFFIHTDMVKLLLQYGADLTAQDSHNNSILSAVCFCQHSAVDFFPVQRIVSTSFDYYERTWAIPPQDLKDHLINEDAYFLWDSDIRRLELLKILINAGADPNLYKTDGMALMDYGEFAKRRMYLILAGSKLSPDDIWVKDEEDAQEGTLQEWLSWFKEQVSEQYSLKRQCRYSIRRSLAATRDINRGIELLPVPSSMKDYLKLEDFDKLMFRFQHFHANSNSDF